MILILVFALFFTTSSARPTAESSEKWYEPYLTGQAFAKPTKEELERLATDSEWYFHWTRKYSSKRDGKKMDGKSLLLTSAANADCATLALLFLREADPNYTEPLGDFPLYCLISEIAYGKIADPIPALRLLLACGANPNKQWFLDEHSQTTHVQRMLYSDRFDIALILLAAGANATTVSDLGESLLDILDAIKDHRYWELSDSNRELMAVVRKFIVNKITHLLRKALVKDDRNEFVRLFTLLLRRDRRYYLKDSICLSALDDYFRRYENGWEEGLMPEKNCFIPEAQHIVTLKLKESHITLLHYAAACNMPKIVNMLLLSGADKNAKDFKGKTPGDYTSGHRNWDSQQFFYEGSGMGMRWGRPLPLFF